LVRWQSRVLGVVAQVSLEGGK